MDFKKIRAVAIYRLLNKKSLENFKKGIDKSN